MSKIDNRRTGSSRVLPLTLVVPIVCASFVGNAWAAGSEKSSALPASAYEKILMRMEQLRIGQRARMEQLEAELKSLKSKQVKQAKKQKKLEEQSASPQVVVVDRAAEVPNAASDSSYIPTRHHGGVYPSGGLKDDIDKPVTARLGAYYGEASVTVLKLFGSNDSAVGIYDDDVVIEGEASRMFSFEHGIDVGGRYEIGYRANRGWGWAARYWQYKSTGEKSLTATADNDVEAFFNYDLDQEFEADLEGDRIDASRSLSFRTLDLEATFARKSENGLSVDLRGGLRYAKIDMTGLWSQFEADGEIEERLEMSNDFQGAGPVLGISMSGQVYQGSLFQISAFGLARGSLLFGSGEFQSVMYQSDSSGTLVSSERGPVVVTAELQLGMEISRKLSNAMPAEVFAKGVLEAQYWGNVGSIGALEALDGDGDMSHIIDSNLGMVGGTFMVGVRTPLGQ